ncbi:MAG: glycine cleavage system aminomethyltransferase GcvT [Cyanobacteria bacterium SIG32]|nr:glycine cleavage system aminomethyltransferase GcvT [Cyanobacteria bacterium SIG32]
MRENFIMVKQTYLHDKHVALGAKMVDFAGWHMPVQYTSIIEEHKNVRENIGLFDVSHMGEVFVVGKDSVEFLNKIVPQDISKLTDGKAVYCQLPNRQGGLIDDLIIYKLKDQTYLVICNASRVDEDINWMSINQKGYDVHLDNQSHNLSLIAVQGPKAIDLMRKLGYSEDQESFTIIESNLLNIPMYISRTGYTGEDGFELLVINEYAEYLWDKLLEEGKEFNTMPIGLGARDTLRLEAALPLYGNDLDEQTTPIEAGLSWSVPKDKVEEYNGKKVIMEQVENGTTKKLIGIKMLDKSIARHEYEVYYNGEKVGIVTSGGVSPMLNANIAMAYVKNIKEICAGAVVQVMIREKLHDAEVVKRPFVAKRNKVKKEK